MMALLLALGALAVGPVLHRAARRMPLLLHGLDGFVLVSVALLLLLFVLPHALESAGYWALPLGLGGFLLPQWIDRFSQTWHHAADKAALALGMVALVIHAATDGVALAGAHAGEPAMAAAVVLHRLPVGMAVWLLVRPALGRRWAVAVLAAVMAATCAGFWLVGTRAGSLDARATALLLAFVSGSLLHVLFHRRTPANVSYGRGANGAEAAGGTLGVLLVVGMAVVGAEYGHGLPAGLHIVGTRFAHLALASAPALLLGYLAAGIVGQMLPPASLGWLSRGAAGSQVARGMAFGLPLPICSCGVVPLYQSLVRTGVPATAGMAFLVATPEIGIEAFLLSFPLLGAELTLMRLAAAAAVAVLVGLTVGRYTEHRSLSAAAAKGTLARPAGTLPQRLRAGVRHGLVDVADDTAVWILAGLGIAALIPPGALGAWFNTAPPGTDLLLAMAVGIPTYVCASGATPIAAALIAAGLSPGAGLTFLLAGPATNITTFGILSRLHGRTVAVLFGAVVALGASLMGAVTNALFGGVTVAVAAATMTHGSLAWVALAVLALVFAATIVRQGPRDFLQTLTKQGGDSREQLAVDGDGDGCCTRAVTRPPAATCCASTPAAPVVAADCCTKYEHG